MDIKLQRNIKSLYLLVLSLLLIQNINCKVYLNGTLTKFAQIRQMYPKVTSYESKNWRMIDSDDYKQHPCKRECVKDKQMTCYYYMVVHYDETMGPGCERYLEARYRIKTGKAGEELVDGFTVHNYDDYDDCKFADGIASEIMVVNGRMPGQGVEVCMGDTIVVDVINSLHETTTIHWHGIHQLKTPHMDGVPHITQYPIEAGQAFRYRFEVDHAGTHWWHSHTEHQRAFGLAGAFIARQPKLENVHAKLYDFDFSEHIIIIQDWVYNFDESIPQNLLINGLGRNVNNDSITKQPTLYSIFKVVRGGRYRFRVIYNGCANCPVSLSIDNHNLVVISSDGNDIEPIIVQKLSIHGGERFDFILHANQEVGNYWLRIKGYNFCKIKSLHQEAILHYMGAKQTERPKGEVTYDYEAEGVELNPLDQAPTKNDERITIVETNSMKPRLEPPMSQQRTHYISMAVHERGNFLFQMDNITFSLPKISLLQTRNLGIGRFFCNKTHQENLGFNCRSRHCRCTNVIQVPAFKETEFVISAITNSAHPIHLHGYTFRVVGMGVLGENLINNIEEIDRKTPLSRRNRNAPLKDTVQVPAFGYTIIRFYADNPGYWILHCHISTHSENGMALVVRVGEDTQMKMCPVSNCGLCSSVV
ncbi:laccase-like [Teleopsis dalmanni]|uniref:laccase-like n=1 Tax=Teleopsis dalmanni TaxID=139649 RepID=UPI0018CEDE07|nr:laccase-like [Teleopsis dalmanni]